MIGFGRSGSNLSYIQVEAERFNTDPEAVWQQVVQRVSTLAHEKSAKVVEVTAQPELRRPLVPVILTATIERVLLDWPDAYAVQGEFIELVEETSLLFWSGLGAAALSYVHEIEEGIDVRDHVLCCFWTTVCAGVTLLEAMVAGGQKSPVWQTADKNENAGRGKSDR